MVLVPPNYIFLNVFDLSLYSCLLSIWFFQMFVSRIQKIKTRVEQGGKGENEKKWGQEWVEIEAEEANYLI